MLTASRCAVLAVLFGAVGYPVTALAQGPGRISVGVAFLAGIDGRDRAARTGCHNSCESPRVGRATVPLLLRSIRGVQ